ncbi:hypothetical protein [Desulfospira joergensenii]|uniref:hypothetical protein n=1 Tax=Desulfospira joergensenii TaxID=53329 RepID=UPI0003B2E5BA|nr:hypothetical protein [Desulfospira joergensenii]
MNTAAKKTQNPLLDPKVVGDRLKALRNGFASNAIEGNPLTEKEKIFLEGLVRKGLTDDQMIIEIKRVLKIES